MNEGGICRAAHNNIYKLHHWFQSFINKDLPKKIKKNRHWWYFIFISVHMGKSTSPIKSHMGTFAFCLKYGFKEWFFLSWIITMQLTINTKSIKSNLTQFSMQNYLIWEHNVGTQKSDNELDRLVLSI